MQTLRQIVRRGGRSIPCFYSLFAVLMSCFFGVRAALFFANVAPHFWVLSRHCHSTSKSSTSPGSELLPRHAELTLPQHRLLPHHTEIVTTWQDDTPLQDHQCTLRQDHCSRHYPCQQVEIVIAHHTKQIFLYMRWTACHDVTPCSSIHHTHRTDIVHVKLQHGHENTSSITVSHRDTNATDTTFTAHGKDHWSLHEDTSTEHVARASSSLFKPSLSLRNQVLLSLSLSLLSPPSSSLSLLTLSPWGRRFVFWLLLRLPCDTGSD